MAAEIHGYAPAPDFPEALCGAGKAWQQPVSCVYPINFNLVTCPGCHAKIDTPEPETVWRDGTEWVSLGAASDVVVSVEVEETEFGTQTTRRYEDGGSSVSVDVPVDLLPQQVRCPNCNAAPGEPCTQPTGDGRAAVRWFHHARVHR